MASDELMDLNEPAQNGNGEEYTVVSQAKKLIVV